MPEPSAFRERPLSFVRRNSRMTDGQERAWTDLAAHYVIDAPRGDTATSVRAGAPIDVGLVWGRDAPLIVEIGSGQGHAIIHAAASRPDTDFLAIEVFTPGLARTMMGAERLGVRNLRLVEANAPEVMEHLLPAASVDELWIFFPDPWHKNKHTKRRLITPGFATIVAHAIRDGGLLRLATDWEQYARQMRDVLDAAPEFARGFEGEWAPRFSGRAMTAFERKGSRAGREIRDLIYTREVRV